MRYLITGVPLFITIFITNVCLANQEFSYKKHVLTSTNSNDNNFAHVLTVNPKNFKIIAVRAQEVGPGFQTVDSMAQHFAALAGINGGFFSLASAESQNLLPAGIFKAKAKWYSTTAKIRGTIGWEPESNTVIFDRVRAVRNGEQIILQPQLDPNSAMAWKKMPYIVGGGPLLIYKSKIITDFNPEKLRADFINQPHARTAVGILADKRWVFVVTSDITIPELSKFMQSLGCVCAVNLDGGGSSSMYVENRNTTLLSRPVADALLIVKR